MLAVLPNTLVKKFAFELFNEALYNAVPFDNALGNALASTVYEPEILTTNDPDVFKVNIDLSNNGVVAS